MAKLSEDIIKNLNDLILHLSKTEVSPARNQQQQSQLLPFLGGFRGSQPVKKALHIGD